MRPALDFRILGPLEVADGGEPLVLGGRKQRALLAILILHANEVVSTDRLIDTLWRGAPPDTAATALHGYVSQLRKVLERDRAPGEPPSVLVTSEPGYTLRIAAEQVDAERFAALLAAARTTLAAGRPEDAERSLRTALGLWRGAPLADLEDEAGIEAELPRLGELRLEAIEERFEARLALGLERDVIAEIERHIAQNPLRERPRGQLMLALYRAGRQAEALRAYQDARRALVEHVGIEPSAELRRLERRMLDQDPSLDRAPRADDPTPGGPARPATHRRRMAAVLLTVGAVAATAGVTFLVRASAGSGSRAAVRVQPDSVAAIDVDTGTVTSDVPISGTPTRVTVGAGAVWVLDADRQVVYRIDPHTNATTSFGTGGVPTDLAAGERALWVGNGHQTRAQFVGPLATTVSRIDADSGAIQATVELPREGHATSNVNGDHIAVTSDAVWVVNPDFSVSTIDPANGEIAGTVRSVSAVAIASGDAGVWVLNDDGSLARVAPQATRQRIRLASNGLSGLAVGAGAVWAAAPYDGVVWRVDTHPRLVERTIPVGAGASAVAVGGGAVWVANALQGTVSRIDPATNRVTRTIAVGGTPRSLAYGEGRLWVAVAGARLTPAAGTASVGVRTPPVETCGKVFYGGPGKPDVLMVSDLPLRGGPRLPTNQMADAIAFVLRERGFRAGRYTVGYQSCDDSTAQTGIFDLAKCTANAKAFAATPAVVGVIGPYNSDCAVEEIPVANTARAGPLAMISPTSSLAGLTRPGPFAPKAALRALYPTGERNYTRLFPTDADQGAADAVLAQGLGARRAFVVSDHGYGEPMAYYFRKAAARIGLRIVGVARWDPHAAGYAGLARRVEHAGPDVVFLSGLLDSNGGAVLRAVRKQVGRRVDVVATDGFLPIADLFRLAGPAARGVHISLPGLLPIVLGPEGRNWVHDFAATQPGIPVHRHSVYAAAAAVTLLDAIARSDGTRADVTRMLLDSHATRSLIGRFRFDARGDIVPSPITIVRAIHGGGDDAVESVDGATIERIIRPLRDP